MTLLKLVASSLEEKVADLSEQCSQHVSSVIGACRNPCLGIKMCQLFQSYSLVTSRLLCGNFIGGEMTVNELHSIANPNRASVKHSA